MRSTALLITVKINCQISYTKALLIFASARKVIKSTGIFELPSSNNSYQKKSNYKVPSR